MTPWPRGHLRWTLIAWICVAAIGTMLLLASRRLNPRTAADVLVDSQIADRRQAAEQAASLLTTAPAPVQPQPAVRPNTDKPGDSLEDLQAFARSWAKSAQVQREDPRPSQPAQIAAGPTGVLRLGRAHDPRPPIPDQIEQPAPLSSSGDTLQSMTLQANLILMDRALAPLVLQEVRFAQSPPQARLGHDRALSEGDGAWFEPGDTPAPGWMLVRIDADSATLMSAHGDLVQLPLDSANAKEANSHVRGGN